MQITGAGLLEVFKNIGASAVASPPSLIDWQLATSIALDLSEDHPISANERQRSLDEYHNAYRRSKDLLQDELQQSITTDIQVLVLSRHEWIAAMSASMEQLFRDVGIEQLFSSNGGGLLHISEHPDLSERFALRAAGALGTMQVGAVLAFLSHKVLGQFDWSFASGPDLLTRYVYFLEPNLSIACRSHGLDAGLFRQWVALHETVHVLQFGGHPWVHEHLRNMIKEYVELVGQELPEAGGSPLKMIATSGSLISPAHMSTQLRALFLRTQAFMSIIEGHADFMMCRGAASLPEHTRYASVFLGKKRKRSFIDALFGKILGFDMKIMQYKRGYRFVNAVVRSTEISFLNRMWISAQNFPSYAELSDPDLWIQRVGRG